MRRISLLSPVSGKQEAASVLVSRTIDFIGWFVVLKLITTYASKSDLGLYFLITSIVALLHTVTFAALSQGILRNVSDYAINEELGERYAAALTSYIILAPVFAFLALQVIELVWLPTGLSSFIPLIIVLLVSESVKNLNFVAASAIRRRHLVMVASALEYLVKIPIIFYCVYINSLHTMDILVAMLLASIVAIAFYIFVQKSTLSRSNLALCVSTMKDAASFSWPMAIWGIFVWAQHMSGRWLLEYHVDIQSVAEYATMVAISYIPINALFAMLIVYIQPIVYEMESKGSDKTIKYLLRTVFIPFPILLFILGATFFFPKEIIELATDEKYSTYSSYLFVMVLCVIFSSIGLLLVILTQAKRKTKSLLVPRIVPGLFSMIAGYFLVEQYQIHGAFVAFCATHIILGVLLIMNFIYVYKSHKYDAVQ